MIEVAEMEKKKKNNLTGSQWFEGVCVCVCVCVCMHMCATTYPGIPKFCT